LTEQTVVRFCEISVQDNPSLPRVASGESRQYTMTALVRHLPYVRSNPSAERPAFVS